ncbi:MAG: hypothetical protein OEZ39_15955 [Gammaproteobacteria bacterium]|nr:hypothetical protein [Gammaproteobacteria bacterium]MDH5653352.1 hypothetical protein [Gammaproteobacteria bacterium]
MNRFILLLQILVPVSLMSMIIGHTGAGDLNWMANQISSYAAHAPLDYFVTAAMLFSAVVLVMLGMLVTRYRVFGENYFADIIPLLAGAAAAGLLLLATFEETARNLHSLRRAGFTAVRSQTFHDAGLLLFYYGSLLLVMLIGGLCLVGRQAVGSRVKGAVIFLLGPLSFILMTTKWPKLLGLAGPTVGLNQRAALFCLWLSIALCIYVASQRMRITDHAE